MTSAKAVLLIAVAILCCAGCGSRTGAPTADSSGSSSVTKPTDPTKADLVAQIQVLKAKYGNDTAGLMNDPKMRDLVTKLQAQNKN